MVWLTPVLTRRASLPWTTQEISKPRDSDRSCDDGFESRTDQRAVGGRVDERLKAFNELESPFARPLSLEVERKEDGLIRFRHGRCNHLHRLVECSLIFLDHRETAEPEFPAFCWRCEESAEGFFQFNFIGDLNGTLLTKE